MAKFPVESDDNVGVVDALNYLLSGPSGLGQNFDGFSSLDANTKSFTGNFEPPYFVEGSYSLQGPEVAVATAEFLDLLTVKFTFASTQASIPYLNGDCVEYFGSSDPYYEGIYVVGVLECTTDYVIVRDIKSYSNTIPAPATGGTLYRTTTYTYYEPATSNPYVWRPTDCQGLAVVTGATDRVFIAGQIDYKINYEIIGTGTKSLTVYFAIDRYKQVPNTAEIQPAYMYEIDAQISRTGTQISGLVGPTGTINYQTGPNFISIIDNPPPGSYKYVIELMFVRGDTTPGNYLNITQYQSQNRSLSVQVVKQ